jgi:hypothetical protein
VRPDDPSARPIVVHDPLKFNKDILEIRPMLVLSSHMKKILVRLILKADTHLDCLLSTSLVVYSPT